LATLVVGVEEADDAGFEDDDEAVMWALWNTLIL